MFSCWCDKVDSYIIMPVNEPITLSRPTNLPVPCHWTSIVYTVISPITVNRFTSTFIGMLLGHPLDWTTDWNWVVTWFAKNWAATWQNQQNECSPSEDSDQPGHPSSLIRVFAVRMKKAWVLSYPLSAQRRLWSDWADAQADLSLRWAHKSLCWFCHVAAQLF